MQTESGVTLSAAMPSRSRCSRQPSVPLVAHATDDPAVEHTIVVDTLRETAKVQMILLPRATELSNPLPQEPISTADAAALAPIEQGAARPIDARL